MNLPLASRTSTFFYARTPPAPAGKAQQHRARVCFSTGKSDTGNMGNGFNIGTLHFRYTKWWIFCRVNHFAIRTISKVGSIRMDHQTTGQDVDFETFCTHCEDLRLQCKPSLHGFCFAYSL
ncbi:hypothetical protein MHYP_G00348330 [Metynnis hypsauchen]